MANTSVPSSRDWLGNVRTNMLAWWWVPHAAMLAASDAAAIFWLKNRDPARWRDAWQLEHVTGKYVISDKPMTEEE